MSEVPLNSGFCCLYVVAEKAPWIKQKELRRLTVEGFSLFGTAISRKLVATTCIRFVASGLFLPRPSAMVTSHLSLNGSVSDQGLSLGVLKSIHSSLSHRIGFPPSTLCSAHTALQGPQRLALHIQPITGTSLRPDAWAMPSLAHLPTVPHTAHVAPFLRRISSAACPTLSQNLHFHFLASCVHLKHRAGGERSGSAETRCCWPAVKQPLSPQSRHVRYFHHHHHRRRRRRHRHLCSGAWISTTGL